MFNKDKFNIKAKIWVYPGDIGWHFITLDEKISSQIRKIFPKGFVKIKVSLNKTSWNTSLFPHKLSKGYILCLKKDIRKKEGIFAGDEIRLKIEFL